MKKVILVMATCLFSLVATGQENSQGKRVKKNQQSEKYCASFKDGRVRVMHEKKEITRDVTLANGIVIKRDGTVIRSDRSITTLRIGECVDNETTAINPKDNDLFNREIDPNVDFAKSK